MKIKYFLKTDTFFIELTASAIVETHDLDAYIIADVDIEGQLCALTIDYASTRAGMPHFLFEQVAA